MYYGKKEINEYVNREYEEEWRAMSKSINTVGETNFIVSHERVSNLQDWCR